MKKLSIYILLPLMLMIFMVPLAFGQADGGVEDSPGWVTTTSFILNAILTAIAFFQNSLKEKAKEGLAKAEQKTEDLGSMAKLKIDQAIGLVNKVVEALEDDKITPEELKGIAKAGKEILNK